MNISFRDIQSTKEKQIYQHFLIKQDLGYKNYDEWIYKAMCEIDSGYKNAITVFSNEQIIGGVMFQKHKTLDRVKEIKNIRMDKSTRGRGLTRCAVTQAEFIDKELYDLIMVDAPKGQEDISEFLLAIGFFPILDTNLYDNNNQDVVFIKPTTERITKDNILFIKNHLIQKSNYHLKDF